MYVACFVCLTLPLRKNLLGWKRKANNIYFALIYLLISFLYLYSVAKTSDGKTVKVCLFFREIQHMGIIIINGHREPELQDFKIVNNILYNLNLTVDNHLLN